MSQHASMIEAATTRYLKMKVAYTLQNTFLMKTNTHVIPSYFLL